MKKPKLPFFLFFGSLFVILINGCEKNTPDPTCDGSMPTYDGEVSTIINNNCMGSNCHSSGSSNGAWTSYSNLQTVLNNGDFEREVLVDQTMPKNGSLTEEELNTLQCWVENGYPEN